MPNGPDVLHRQIAAVTARIHGRALDAHLQSWLNQEAGAGTTQSRLLLLHRRECRSGNGGSKCPLR